MNQTFSQHRDFAVSVTFYSQMRKTVPSAGYRPHVIMDDDPEMEYLGVCFYDVEIDAFDHAGHAMCVCMYEDQGVGYQKIISGKAFKVMEGPHVVGAGKVVDL